MQKFLLIIASLLNIGFAELVIDDSTVESANPDAGNNDSDVGEYAAADQNPLKQGLHEDYTNGDDINQRRLRKRRGGKFREKLKNGFKKMVQVARKVKNVVTGTSKSATATAQAPDSGDSPAADSGDSPAADSGDSPVSDSEDQASPSGGGSDPKTTEAMTKIIDHLLNIIEEYIMKKKS
jgi:hypothetical protein